MTERPNSFMFGCDFPNRKAIGLCRQKTRGACVERPIAHLTLGRDERAPTFLTTNHQFGFYFNRTLFLQIVWARYPICSWHVCTMPRTRGCTGEACGG